MPIVSATTGENNRPLFGQGGLREGGALETSAILPQTPEAVKKFKGREALLRVRDAKPNTDAEHRV
ncbi:MAG: hypothetical protein L0312_31065, partial [Acidobacteria bacterium]|nr:hypothetical protein [Acidobacteriota bacterium]